ncbi:hypothetical protein FSP39_019018 [Pinctada imbricata]|uniref:Uncharacterized protein n=1 Tax=Pinctada imbricata TaxID=66713 RepID=A0AA88YFR1_PINIB|nr:hypothetical protein FSP39_019018 [Pinctada imbricata]
MPVSKADDNGEKKMGSHAEVVAMKFNLKEARYLQKNLHLIDLEKQSSLNLINLDNRDVRIRYKKLKENVGKIKSHLTATEISEMRHLDECGKLEGAYTSVTPNLHARIVAEAKRLKMNPQPSRPMTNTPLRRRMSTKDHDEYQVKTEERVRPQSENIALLRRETIRNALLRNEGTGTPRSVAGASQKVQRYRNTQQNLSQRVTQYKDSKSQEKVAYGIYDPNGQCISHQPASQLRRSKTEVCEKSKPVVSINRTHSHKETLTATLPLTESKSDVSENEFVIPNQPKLAFVENDSTAIDASKVKKLQRPKRPQRPLSSVQNSTIDEDDGKSELSSTLTASESLTLEHSFNGKSEPSPRQGRMKILSTKTFSAEEVSKMRNQETPTDDRVFESPTFTEFTSETPDLKATERTTCEEKVHKQPISTVNGQVKDSKMSIKKNLRKFRPATTTGVSERTSKPSVTPKRPQTSKTLRPVSGQSFKPMMKRSNSFLTTSFGGASNSAFSCHSNAEKDARDSITPRGASVETGRTRQLQDEIQDNLGENIHRELRKDLLIKEQEMTSKIEDKVTGFMKRLDGYIQRAKREEAEQNRNPMRLNLFY